MMKIYFKNKLFISKIHISIKITYKIKYYRVTYNKFSKISIINHKIKVLFKIKLIFRNNSLFKIFVNL